VFQIKICGVTSPLDAEMVALAGPDAVGLNFCPASPRCVSRAVAEAVDQVLPGEIARVAVLVNAELDEIRALADHVRLDYLQLHGDEPPRMVADLSHQLPGIPVIRAFRCRETDLEEVVQYVRECSDRGAELAGILVDAFHPGQYGGTGLTVDLQALARRPPALRPYPLILAGGLRSHNVAEAIRIVQPAAVDTASGVEMSAGRKDRAMVQAFVKAARAAFETRGEG
jgi:phosphoribosylanthranilate isomerase